MKRNRKLSAYILRGSMAALLFSCVLVALCSAIHVPEQRPKVLPPRDNAGFRANGTLTFADRVAYQRAIEDVYWRHRIWPKERHDPKPSLDAVMSQAQIEKKVMEYLHNSQALEDDSQRPITADQLQAEMERMASHTKQPDVLRELFEALGNEPFVIAECLARPVLAQRLVRELKNEERVQLTTVAWLRDPLQSGIATAETQAPKKVAAIETRSLPSSLAAAHRGFTFYLADPSARLDSVAKAVQVNRPYHLPVIAGPSGDCIDDTWTATTLTNAPSARSNHTAVWTGSEMIVWAGQNDTGQRDRKKWPNPPQYAQLNTGGRYNPTTDTWTSTSTTNAPSARHNHTAVWTGTEMIVWGGYTGPGGIYFNTGGRYDPSTDSWTATTTNKAPTPRATLTAVWTGSEMIVWGGDNGISYFNTGGRYDPGTDSWTATSTTNAPTGRCCHWAVWAPPGSEMIIWGGYSGSSLNTGGRYDPSTDSWTATTTTNAPAARFQPRAVWTGSEMIVWGGSDGSSYFNTGGRYDPGSDSWTATSTTNAPEGRYTQTQVWTGSEMIVWGGINLSCCDFNTGGRYDPNTDTWAATSTTGAPSPRWIQAGVWTGSEMVVWGGYNITSGFLNTGGRYCAAGGLAVISSDPACGSVVFTQLTDFVINLTDPVQPATVQASDFTVNGTPAESFTLSNGNATITFHYTSSPVTTQGAQTMHIPAGAFLRDPDGEPVMEFDCTFRYDATLLAVTNTVPPVGGTFSPPAPGTYEYDVNWNEAVDPTSVQASDLTLSGNTGATVTNVVLINGDTTIRFTLNIPFGGSLTADIAAGAITDQFGNLNADFSGSYTVEGSPSPCLPPPPNLVSWWPGDGNADDIIGSNNGTLHNGATFAPGMVDQAFSFDGVDDYVEATDTDLPFGNDERTLDFWMKPMPNARVPVIYGDFQPNDAFYVIVIGANACIGQWGGGDVCGSTDVTDGSWHHIALTYDGVSSAVLYVDGALETSVSKTYTTTQTGTLLIGGTVVSPFDYFEGLVDELDIFNRALSQPEIQFIYDAGSEGKCKPQGTPTPTPTATATPTTTATPTATATPTPTATATATPSATPRVTPRPRPTPHPRP